LLFSSFQLLKGGGNQASHGKIDNYLFGARRTTKIFSKLITKRHMRD